jgi:hypothetical protein
MFKLKQQKENKMRKITKTLLVLVSSLSMSFAAIAGEVTMSGSAKASYKIGGTDDSMGTGIGVTNELKAAASGELDNGYTWNYHIDIDPGAAGAMVQDDAALTLNMNNLGTIGFFDGEGSMDSNLKWGVGALGTGSDYAGTMTINYGYDIDSNPNIQYHTPDDLLPLGIKAKFGHAPSLADAAGGNDYKSSAGVSTATPLVGDQLTQYYVEMSPIDGLSLHADYADTDNGTATAQSAESGGYAAKYAIGNFKVGYGKEYYAIPITAKNGAVTKYETDSYGIEMAVNDQISISYTQEKSDQYTDVTIVAAKTSGTKTVIEADVTTIQAAYVVGGATLGVAIAESDNADYVVGKKEKVTVFSLAMAPPTK